LLIRTKLKVLKKIYKYILPNTRLRKWLMLFILTFPFYSFSQTDSLKTKKDSIPNLTRSTKDSPKKIVATFDTIPYNLKEGDIISKTLKIQNNSGKPFSFTVEVDHPPQWKTFNSRSRLYSVNTGDSIFIPVRVVPVGKILGNTKYRINAYVFEQDSTPVATDHFYVVRNKQSNWGISVIPGDKIYFLNKENKTRFDVTISNNGNEEQAVVLGFENSRRNIILSDSTDKIIKNKLINIKLKPGEDTTFKYTATYNEGVRNQKRVDTEGYKPISNSENHSTPVYVNTSEAKTSGGAALRSKKVSFIKLGNEMQVNKYGYSAFPLIMDANVYNIIAGQPIMSLNLRGTTGFVGISGDAVLNYYSQFFFSSPFYTNDYLFNSYNYIGYFDNKYSFELGDIGGNVGGYGSPGKGFSAGYQFLPEHKISAFYTRSSLFSKADREGFGVGYRFTPKYGTFNVSYTRSLYKPSRLTSDYIGGNASVPFGGRHSVSVGAFVANHNSTQLLNSYTRTGFQLYAGYAGSYLKDSRLHTSLNGSYMSKYFDPNNAGHMVTGNLTNVFAVNKKTSLSLSNTYNEIDYRPVLNNSPSYYSYALSNTLGTSFRSGTNYVSPGIFYNVNYYEQPTQTHLYHTRGISIGTGRYEYETNKLLSASVMAGYNREINIQPVRDYFFLQFIAIYRYKVYSASLRYSDGSISPAGNVLNNGFTPQVVAASFSHQYQFADPHLILQNYFTYSYYSAFKRQSFSYTPELYYYTNSGWRFKFSPAIYWSRSTSLGEGFSNLFSYANLGQSSTNTNTTVSVTVGVRKEFGIPNPFSKKRYHTLDFVAFIDLNGNKKKDPGEYLLENVVVRLGEWEVLTNEKGRASIKNIPMNKYKYTSFSLVDLEGFFPNIDEDLDVFKNKTGDSCVFVPYVKGIKIYGKVVVDRENVAENVDQALDLSSIKVSAINGRTINSLTERDGSFQFYVPYGHYVLHLSENILGDRFKILQNDIELKLDRTTESMFITFFIIEKKRTINKKRFDADGHLINDGSGSNKGLHDGSTDVTSEGANPNAGKDLVAEANAAAAQVSPRPMNDAAKDVFLKDKKNATTTRGLLYTVQLGAFQKPLNPNIFKGLKNLMYERMDNEFVRVTVGVISTEAEAEAEKNNLAKVGFPSAFVTAYNNGKSIPLTDAAQVKKGVVNNNAVNKTPVNKAGVNKAQVNKAAVNKAPVKKATGK
jgi:hypothetical protein